MTGRMHGQLANTLDTFRSQTLWDGADVSNSHVVLSLRLYLVDHHSELDPVSNNSPQTWAVEA